MVHFCLAMENYFTSLKVIKRLRECGIGVVVTVGFKRAWPPVQSRDIGQDKCAFNDFYWMVDGFGTLVA